MSNKINSENIQFIMKFANTIEEEQKAYDNLIKVEKVNKVVLHNLKKNDPRIKFLQKIK